MEVLLDLLEDEALWIRYYTIDLLTILLGVKKQLFEERIKMCPIGIPKMVSNINILCNNIGAFFHIDLNIYSYVRLIVG